MSATPRPKEQAIIAAAGPTAPSAGASADRLTTTHGGAVPGAPALAAVIPPSVYLTPRDVARLLQVSEKSVYRWAAEDPTLPTLRLGHTVRFPAARFMTWLRDREQGRSSRPRMRNQVRSIAKPVSTHEAARA